MQGQSSLTLGSIFYSRLPWVNTFHIYYTRDYTTDVLCRLPLNNSESLHVALILWSQFRLSNKRNRDLPCQGYSCIIMHAFGQVELAIQFFFWPCVLFPLIRVVRKFSSQSLIYVSRPFINGLMTDHEGKTLLFQIYLPTFQKISTEICHWICVYLSHIVSIK